MLAFRSVGVCLLFAAVVIAPPRATAQQKDEHAFVRSIVNNELQADANDHSRWMFKDTNKTPAGSTVKLVVQTAQGDLSQTIEMNGRAPTAQQRSQDQQKMRNFVNNAAVRQKQKRDAQQDDKRAASLTKMLPDAFLWTKTGESGPETTLAFKPDPKFTPPSREARVFAVMAGTLVVNTQQKRIKALKGALTQDVDFGFGLLGRLQKGGTFHVERQEVGRGIWEITSTHIHIQGRALIFKSIGEQQDEVTSNYKPAPPTLTLPEAAKMLNDGTVAKALGITKPE